MSKTRSQMLSIPASNTAQLLSCNSMTRFESAMADKNRFTLCWWIHTLIEVALVAKALLMRTCCAIQKWHFQDKSAGKFGAQYHQLNLCAQTAGTLSRFSMGTVFASCILMASGIRTRVRDFGSADDEAYISARKQ